MSYIDSSLVCCSSCGHSLEFFGTSGALLKTKCLGCGITSVDVEPPITRSKQPEVYYNKSRYSRSCDSSTP